MIDSNGNIVEDTWSVSAEDYLAGQGNSSCKVYSHDSSTVPMMDPMMILLMMIFPMTIFHTTNSLCTTPMTIHMTTPTMTPMTRITDHP